MNKNVLTAVRTALIAIILIPTILFILSVLLPVFLIRPDDTFWVTVMEDGVAHTYLGQLYTTILKFIAYRFMGV